MLNRIADHLPAFSSPPQKNVAEATDEVFAGLKLRSYLEPIEQTVKQHPGAALAAAFLVGVTVAWWIKRR